MSLNRANSSAVLVLIGALCFSSSGFLQAIAPSGATPYVIAGCRMLLASAALYVYIRITSRHPNWKNWPWRYILTYATALCLYQICFFNAILLVGVAVGTVVCIGITPIFSGLIAWLLSGKPPRLSWIIATAIAIMGLVLVNSFSDAQFDWYALILPILAGACYAIELSVSKPLTEHHTPQEAMMLVTLLAGLGLLPFFLIYPTEWILTAHGLLISIALGVLTCALPYTLIVKGLQTTPTPVASTLALGEPLGAALLGILILKEPCPTATQIGIALLFISLMILIVEEARQEKNFTNHHRTNTSDSV